QAQVKTRAADRTRPERTRARDVDDRLRAIDHRRTWHRIRVSYGHGLVWREAHVEEPGAAEVLAHAVIARDLALAHLHRLAAHLRLHLVEAVAGRVDAIPIFLARITAVLGEAQLQRERALGVVAKLVLGVDRPAVRERDVLGQHAHVAG